MLIFLCYFMIYYYIYYFANYFFMSYKIFNNNNIFDNNGNVNGDILKFFYNGSVCHENYKYDNSLINFLSKKNIDYIQKKIKTFVYNITNKKFKLIVDQKILDIIIVMRYIYIENYELINSNINNIVQNLNIKLLQFIIPDIIENIKLQHININTLDNPRQSLLPHPINVNNFKNKTLPPLTIIWEK